MSATTAIDTYRWGRARMLELVAGADTDTAVTACPGWRVRDVVAHVTGVASDFVGGRLPSGDIGAWTAEQVEARGALSFDAVLGEWEEQVPAFEAAMTSRLSAAAPRFAADVVSHTFDVAGALDRPCPRRGNEVDFALATFVSMLSDRLDSAGKGSLTIQAGSQLLIAGTGQPAASITAEPFEAMRALSGRRTAGELRDLAWAGEKDEVIGLMSPFPLPVQSLGE
jgi:uncharacterized protein (TIGR03083 family)